MYRIGCKKTINKYFTCDIISEGNQKNLLIYLKFKVRTKATTRRQ